MSINWQWRKPAVPAAPAATKDGLSRALYKAQQLRTPRYPFQAPALARGVLPDGVQAPVAIAMDDFHGQYGASAYGFGDVAGFPGYQHLSALALRAEFRNMANSISTEITREWIELRSSETAGDETKAKVTELTQKLKDIGLQQIIQRAAEQECLFGRAQLLISIKGHDLDTPLVLDKRTIKPDSFDKVTVVEPIWTSPQVWNSLRPQDSDFYRPAKWWMLGQPVHATRLLTIITRQVPDMFKAAFNFSGISLSQLAEKYVEQWLRTKTSVADLINNFSITALATSMDGVLIGSDDGEDLMNRADLFTAMRSNKGLMLLDKDREELVQVNTPLGGLHELQAQALEHLCSVSRIPAVILTGVSPSGLNASSEGEIRIFYDYISALQENFWRSPIDTILKVLQLSMYASVDPDISFGFVPLFQMNQTELASIRTADATNAQTYVNMGAVSAEEVRELLARDPESGYQGLDLSVDVSTPEDEDDEEAAQ